jgi:hypothetical protein
MKSSMFNPCSVRDLKKALGRCRDDLVIYSCCVLHNLETDEYEAYAVVSSSDGGREVEVGGWPVFLLRPDAPLSEYVRRCRLGDIFLCYQVVSVDGSPILPEAERERLYRDLQQEELSEMELLDRSVGGGATPTLMQQR